jgi:hypothetical protein
MIEIRLDKNKIRQFEQMLAGIPNALPRVMVRGLNRTADQTRTQLSRLINRRLNILVRFARKNVYVRHANYKDWRAKVDVSNFRPNIALLSPPPQQTSEGVSYSIGGRRTVLLRHAFIAVGQKKGRNVWLRSLHQIGYRKFIDWRGRTMEAMYVQKAPGLGEMLLNEASADVNLIYAESAAKLEKNIHDQVQLILRRRAVA